MRSSDGVSGNSSQRGKTNRLWAALPLGVTLALFLPVLSHQFVWDDTIYLQVQLPAFQSFWDAFFPGERIGQFYDRYYRPLVYVSYYLDRLIWGIDPFGFHLTVLLFHLACTLFVFLIGKQLFHENGTVPLQALFASLVFGVHPVHAESVAWVSGRSDVIAGFFILVSVWLAFRSRMSGGKASLSLASSFFFFLALLSKETSVAILAVFSLMIFILPTDNRSQSLGARSRFLLYPLGAVLAYFLLRKTAMESLIGAHGWAVPSPWDAFERVVNSYGFYMWKMLWPLNLNAFIERLPQISFLSLFGVFLCGAVLFLTVFGWKNRDMAFLIGGGWVLATLSPSILISFTGVPTPWAERYLYIPSVGFSFVLTGLFVRLLEGNPFGLAFRRPFRPLLKIGRPLIGGVAVAMLVGSSILTAARLPIWKNNFSFWTEAVRANPTAWLPHQNLGQVYSERADYPMAENALKAALARARKPEEISSTLGSLGIVYMRQGKPREAEEALLNALKNGSVSPYVFYALGFLYAYQLVAEKEDPQQRKNRMEKALFFTEKAVGLNPFDIQAYYLLGELNMAQGSNEGAREAYQKVLILSGATPSPMAQQARVKLAEIYFRRGNEFFLEKRLESAVASYRKSVQMAPQFTEGYYHLGVALSDLGLTGEAIEAYRVAIRQNPRHAKARLNLAYLLEKAGNMDEAREEFQALSALEGISDRFLREAREGVGRLNLP